MQQWYKMDVVKRFHLYHSLNSSLQLETLSVKQLGLNKNNKKIKETKDYHAIEPDLLASVMGWFECNLKFLNRRFRCE